jgi:mxaA protein
MSLRRTALAPVALLLAVTALPTATLALEQATASDATTSPATVEQPRPFGYVIGDVVTQRILLTTGRAELEPAELPNNQRVSIWLERRASRIESTPDGRRWLVVDYQVTNAPQTLASISVPAWELVSTSDRTKLSIPAWPISVAALIPADSPPSTEQLRPDRSARVIATAPTRTRLLLASLALVITLAAWLVWARWRDVRERANLPFARALHEIRHQSDAAPQAWQTLHRAFDQTAGRVIDVATLPTLFQRAPHLQPLHAEIERFFAQSNERFFGAGLEEQPVSTHALCRELRRLEKRYAR